MTRSVFLRHSLTTLLATLAVWVAGGQPSGMAAETANPTAMSKTLIVLKLDSNEPLEFQTKFLEQPPSIILEFPSHRVVGSLPDRSAVGRGVIQMIFARYQENAAASPKRYIQSLQIVLSAPYASHVRSEPGRVVIEIEHPASVNSAEVEVGLKGGTIIGALGPRSISERFRAMQEALTSVTPTTWTLQFGSSTPQRSTESTGGASSGSRVGESKGAQTLPAASAAVSQGRLASNQIQIIRKASPSVWWIGLLCLGAIGFSAWWLARRSSGSTFFRAAGSRQSGHASSGMVLVDQLVWRAFERQGYQLVIEKELTRPPTGTFRIITKEGSKAGLICVSNGPFFEKQTVARFLRVIQEANLERGYLVAAGSFTVPAQRLAKEHHITLIGREELTELLSVGAASEYMAKQLEQQQARLEEAKETLRQYASELDTLRRQRNEASWYLGEERAKSGKLDADLEVAGRQVMQLEAELKRWQDDAAAQRKRWEESEWYLGESRTRVQHFETALATVQKVADRVEVAERERADTQQMLLTAQERQQTFEASLAALQQQLEASKTREGELKETIARLHAELASLREHWGERRGSARTHSADVFIELQSETDSPCFAGSPRDVSGVGFGLATDYELSMGSPLRVRVNLPGANKPIESTAQLIWQQTQTEHPSRFQSGFQFLELSTASKRRLERFVGQTQPSSSS